MKPALKVNSNDVDPNPDQHEGEVSDWFMEEERVKNSISYPLDGKFHEGFIKLNSQKEVLNCKHKAPDNVAFSQASNVPNW